MNKYLFLSLLVCVLVSSAGCRRQAMSRSATSAAPPSPTTDSAGSVRQPTGNVTSVDSTKANLPTGSASATTEAHSNVAEIDFRYLTAKSKISFKSQTQEIDNATVNIRVRADSLIWLSISKLGIEGARVLITRDSITIMDKINRAYSASDFATLSRQFNFGLNFQLLQAMIVGNLPFPGIPAQTVDSSQDYRVLRQQEGQILVENYIGKVDRKVKKLTMIQQPANNRLQLEYADFSPLNSFLFPFTSLLTLDSQSKTDGQFHQTVIHIQYSKVELIDKSPEFPFTIPAGYQRRP